MPLAFLSAALHTIKTFKNLILDYVKRIFLLLLT